MSNNSTFSTVSYISESERLTGNQGVQKFHLSLLVSLCVDREPEQKQIC